MTIRLRSLVGGTLYDIPQAKATLGFEFSDVSSLKITYPKSGVNADKVVEDAVIIAYNNNVEIRNGRWRCLASSGEHVEDTTGFIQITAVSLVDIFRRTNVRLASGTQSVQYTNKTHGFIMNDLFTTAQARGAMTGITWDFTAINDSSGTPWPGPVSREYEKGASYYNILQSFVDDLDVEYRFNGTVFQMFAKNQMGLDRFTTTGAVTEFVGGRDYTETPWKRSIEDRAHVMMVIGEEGKHGLYTAAGSGPFGKEETAVNQSSIGDQAALDYLANLYGAKVALLRESLTRKINLAACPYTPIAQFEVSDWVREKVDGSSMVYRIRGMALDISPDEPTTVSIVLNDKFLEAAIRLSRRIDYIGGGLTGNASAPATTTPPAQPADTKTPSPPTGLSISSDSFIDSKGVQQALMFAQWLAPTTNTDSSLLTDLQDYEFQWRYSTGQSRRNLVRNPAYRKTNSTQAVRTNKIINPAFRDVPATLYEIRRNLATNPGSESGAFPSNNGTNYPTSVDTTVKRSGAQSTKSTPVTGQNILGSAFNVGGNPIAAAPGDVIGASVHVAHNAAVVASASVFISWLDATATQIGTSSTTTVTGIVGNSTFSTRMFVTGTAPAGTTQYRIISTITRSTGTVLTGEFCWWDDVCIEKAGVLMPYFDGSTAAFDGLTASWTGTAGASASILQGKRPSGWGTSISAAGTGTYWVDTVTNILHIQDFKNGGAFNIITATVTGWNETFAGAHLIYTLESDTAINAVSYLSFGASTAGRVFTTTALTPATPVTVDTQIVNNGAGTAGANSQFALGFHPPSNGQNSGAHLKIQRVLVAGPYDTGEYFDGATTYENLATGIVYTSLGGGTVVTPNVSFGGKKWTRVKHPTGGSGARLNTVLAKLVNGTTYTVSATVYNESDSTVNVSCEWVDGGSQGPASGFYSLQPRETKRLYGINSRATYDSTYRFHDIEFNTGFNGSVLVTDVLIEPATKPNWFYAGVVSKRNNLTNAWASTANASESTQTGPTATYNALGQYASTVGSVGWQVDPSGVERIRYRQAVAAGGILAFDTGSGSPAVAGKYYAGRIKVRNIGPSSVQLKFTLGQYDSSNANVGWFNDGVLVTVPVGLDYTEISLPNEFVGAATVATGRFLLYADPAGTGVPVGTELEFKDPILEEVAGPGYEASQHFTGSSPMTADFKFTWAGAVDDSFSDKTIRSTTDNNWRSMILKDPVAFVPNVIPGSVVEARVRARKSNNTNVSTWNTAFGYIDSDSYGPPAPSAPILTSKLGTITVAWDGLGSSGEDMPPDFDAVNVHMALSTGFTPDAGNKIGYLGKAGALVVTGQAGGTIRYFKFVAVDASGNESEQSAESSITVVRIAGPDIQANSVTANELAVGSVHAEHIQLGVIASNMMRDPSFEEDYEVVECEPFLAYGSGDYWKWRREAYAVGGEVVTKLATGRSRSGKRGLAITTPTGGDTSAISPPMKIEAGKTYQFSIYACSVGGQALLSVQLGWGGDPNNPGSPSMFNNDITLVGDTDNWVSPPITTDPVDPEAFELYSWSFTPAAGQEWLAWRISNLFPGATSTLVVDDISVVELGVGATEITAAGFRLFGPDGKEIGAFVSNRPNYLSIQQNEELVASISSQGVGSFTELNVRGTDSNGDDIPDSGFQIYGKEFTDWMDDYGQSDIAFGYRSTTPASYSATEAPYQQLDFVAFPGRLYQMTAIGYVANDGTGRSLARLRYRLDGTAAGITDTQRCTWRTPAMGAGIAGKFHLIDYISPAAVGGPPVEVSYVLTVIPEGGGNSKFIASSADPVFMEVQDIGEYKGDVGIDRTGGSPPPTKKTYVTTWTANSSESYRGDGTARTDTTDLVQGYNSYNGLGHALVLFTAANSTGGETAKTIATALSGATISKVEVYLYANHWYYNSGGTAYIRASTNTALTSATPSGTAVTSASWPKPGGRWVNITSIFTASHRSVWIGKPPSNSLTYYGRFNYQGNSSGKPLLRITYVK